MWLIEKIKCLFRGHHYRKIRVPNWILVYGDKGAERLKVDVKHSVGSCTKCGGGEIK